MTDFENDQRIDSILISKHICLECGKEFEVFSVYPITDETCGNCKYGEVAPSPTEAHDFEDYNEIDKVGDEDEKSAGNNPPLSTSPQNCGNCIYADESLCDHVAGENFGFWTEISMNYKCENYRPTPSEYPSPSESLGVSPGGESSSDSEGGSFKEERKEEDRNEVDRGIEEDKGFGKEERRLEGENR